MISKILMQLGFMQPDAHFIHTKYLAKCNVNAKSLFKEITKNLIKNGKCNVTSWDPVTTEILLDTLFEVGLEFVTYKEHGYEVINVKLK